MTLQVVSDTAGVPSNWDWKASYIERLREGAGMEIFSEQSVTPDTMLLMAGPPRLGVNGFEQMLSPIGLVTNVNFSTDNGLRPIWEIGTDHTYFTRGKAIHTMNIGAMVANKPSLMKLMSRQSPQSTSDYPKDNTGQFWMNLDTETLAKPFGILIIFKTKGGSWNGNGDFVGGIYLENCNINNFSWGIDAQSISLQENIAIMFDRAIAVDYEV